MNRLKILSLYDNIYFIAIGVLLVSLFKYTFFLIPIYLFYLRKRNIFTLTFIFMSLFSFRLILKVYKPFPISNKISGLIVDVKENNYILKTNIHKVIVYTNDTLSLGDYVKVEGTYRIINYPTIPFDYNDYYLKHDIKYIFYANKIEKKKIFNIYTIRNNLINYFDANYSETSSQFYKSLILGYKNDLEIKDELNMLGISHLFSISGLHILLIAKILSFFLKKKYINIILVIYVLITGFSPSIVRASSMVILANYFKYKKLEFSRLDILCFIFIFLLFINPYYIFDTGFELSFLISFSIVISDFDKHKLIKISLLTFSISLPIVVNMNNKINILSPIYNIILIGFFSFIFLPITYITAFIRNFKPYELLCKLFINVINILSNIKFSVITMPSFNSIEMLFYYLSLYFFLSMKKIIFLLIFFALIFLKGKIVVGGYVKIFDCGQGDSSLIRTSNYTILIDCYNDTYKYLIKEGINHIDYLIITHGHDDHASDLMDIYYSTITVDYLVVSYYDQTELTQQALEYYKNVIYLKGGDELDLKKLNIKCLTPYKDSSNVNNISLVLKINVLKKTFLFMGDFEDEESLVNMDLKCDILKVGHHGASNAFTKAFLDKCNPSVAVISCGAYNKFKHPHKVVIDYLEEHKIKYYITYINRTYTYKTYFT